MLVIDWIVTKRNGKQHWFLITIYCDVYYYPPWKDEATEAYGDEVTWPMKAVEAHAELGF